MPLETPNPDKCPEAVQHHLKQWADGDPTVLTGFIQAILENDLFETYSLASDENMAAMHHIASYVICRMPRACYGSPTRVEAWRQQKERDRRASPVR